MKLNKSSISKIGLFWFLVTVISLSSCKKQDGFLNVKNNKSDVNPQTLQDLQAVLDNDVVFNSLESVLGLIGSDNIYVTDKKLDAETEVDRNTYVWAKDIYQGAIASDWTEDYQAIEYANIVLDGLNSLSSSQTSSVTGQNIKGQALFLRSFAFYQLTQLYCKPYIAATANTDPGVPVRLTSDVNQKVGRGTVQQVYDQMIGDLKTAVTLLPSFAQYKSRANSDAANGLLAKIYLSMADYQNAFKYADAALQINNTLLDFNSLSTTSTAPFPSFSQGNPEIIFYAYCYGETMIGYNSHVNGRAAPDFYNSYITGDLRKVLYFISDGTGYYRPKGGYSDKAGIFGGISNNELFLIRAECAARTGNISSALADINALLQKRYTPASYSAFSNTDPTALLTEILTERRKELALTGNMRWEDLRRLNMDSRFAINLQRIYHSVTYTLPAGDPRYVLPIPDDEITLDGLQQNPR